MHPLYLGLDFGTSSLKTLLLDSTGTVYARTTAHYPTTSASANEAEQDPEDWLRALSTALAAIPDGLRTRITAIAADGHVPSLVPVDVRGVPTHPCLTWQDARAVTEATALEARFGDPRALLGTTLPWAPSQLPAKAAWLARAHGTAGVHALLSPKDFVGHALTGEFATDAWTSKGLCNVRTAEPVAELLDAAGWTDAALPRVRAPWDTLGVVSATAAQRFGLRPGTHVAVGWTDAMTSILAAGGFDSPAGVVLTGTSEIVGASAPRAREIDGLYLVPATVAPLALSYGPTQSSGASLLWIAETLGLSVPAALNAAAAAGTDVPLFVPYLRGERAPLWNPRVRGTFLGLSDTHGPGELVRAVLEGVALSGRHVLSRATEATALDVTTVNVGGRGIDHPAWLAARGGILGTPLRLHSEENLAALGAAMIAALSDGAALPDLERLRSAVTLHRPTPDESERGVERYARYLAAVTITEHWSTL